MSSFALAWCALHGGASTAQAAPFLYGTGHASLLDSTIFYSINPITGAATVIGNIGFSNVTGMDFNPITGVLYAEGVNGSTGILLTINPLTGVGTSIGATGVSSAFSDLSFRSDGTLFGYNSGSIYTFNLSTGAATLIGFTGVITDGGLAFDSSDTLHIVNNGNAATINTNTAARDVGATMDYSPLSSSTRPSGMDYEPGTGVLWAITNANSNGATPDYLTTINTATGTISVVGQTTNGMDALVVFVPEPSAVATLALATFSFLGCSRRRRA
ncbi:MAG: hypothetical protein ABJF10_22855 [Chthoniobacter sp.]|uniref:hypothetical protein n=1 Tax=Chthoniobacter sp. TaxID=2510640 RepID=UPI0032ACD8DF